MREGEKRKKSLCSIFCTQVYHWPWRSKLGHHQFSRGRGRSYAPTWAHARAHARGEQRDKSQFVGGLVYYTIDICSGGLKSGSLWNLKADSIRSSACSTRVWLIWDENGFSQCDPDRCLIHSVSVTRDRRIPLYTHSLARLYCMQVHTTHGYGLERRSTSDVHTETSWIRT